ncbi:calcium-binding protein [Arenibacterium sp. LLYu02]|uniref:calcium-binding protein n=1 Tax=Arenibacterium sp. LLYu02 TaxID=3404132 RepID=UPI003B222E1F
MTSIPTSGNDFIEGTPEDDALGGYLGNDTLVGGGGNDVFYEGFAYWYDRAAGTEFSYGGLYNFGVGSDEIAGGRGSDTITYIGREVDFVVDLRAQEIRNVAEIDHYTGIEVIELGAGDDLVLLNRAAMQLDLGAGNDTVIGLKDGTYIDAGSGRNVLDLRAVAMEVSFDMQRGAAQGNGNDIDARLSGFTTVFGARRYENDILGTESRDHIEGGSLNDDLSGNHGNDRLFGFGGADALSGGEGSDLIVGGSGGDGISGGTGYDTIRAGAGDDGVSDQDGGDIRLGSGEDSFSGMGDVRGQSGADTFYIFGRGQYHGDGGRDKFNIRTTEFTRVDGGSGDDWFALSAEANTMSGFYGQIDGGAGHDRMLMAGGYIRILSPSDSSDYGGAGVLNIESITNQSGAVNILIEADDFYFESLGGATTGQIWSDNVKFISAGLSDNVTVYYADNVYVRTLGGADNVQIEGSEGFYIDTSYGTDDIFVSGGSGTLLAGAGNDTLFLQDYPTDGGIVIDMGEGADTVTAGGLFQSIDLGSGSDRIIINWNAEGEITLGRGADVIVLTSSGSSDLNVTITDFDVAVDRFDFREVTEVSDLAAITQEETGVRLSLAGNGAEFLLAGLTVEEITDTLFL